MFNISGAELLLVAIVALIVLGPQQLQTLAKHLGAWIKYARALMASVQAEFKQHELKQKLAENEARADAAQGQSKND